MKKDTIATPGAASLTHNDGWANLLTSMGVKGRDKTQATRYQMSPRLHHVELENLYEGDGLARLIVDVVAETMTREWIQVEADTFGDAIAAKLESLNAKTAITDLVRWSRLHGGALLVMGLADGNVELSEPLNERALQDIIFLRVFDKSEVSYSGTDIYTDPTESKFGMPKFYNVSSAGGINMKVHESRCLRMDGDPLTNRQKATNNWWGASVLQACYDDLRGLGSAYWGCSNIVTEFVLGTLTISNLQDLIGAGQEDLIVKRLLLMDMSKSIMNSILVDENEKYERQSATVTGLPDLLDRFVKKLSATSRIPVTVLMGQAPAGLNATGDSDIRNWYDAIAAEQSDRLAPVLKRLITLMMMCKAGPTNGQMPKEWVLKFNPLWQLTDKEQAELRKLTAESDALYIDRQVLDPQEVRESRFGANAYSMETTLNEQYTPDYDREPPETMMPTPSRTAPTAEEDPESDDDA